MAPEHLQEEHSPSWEQSGLERHFFSNLPQECDVYCCSRLGMDGKVETLKSFERGPKNSGLHRLLSLLSNIIASAQLIRWKMLLEEFG